MLKRSCLSWMYSADNTASLQGRHRVQYDDGDKVSMLLLLLLLKADSTSSLCNPQRGASGGVEPQRADMATGRAGLPGARYRPVQDCAMSTDAPHKALGLLPSLQCLKPAS